MCAGCHGYYYGDMSVLALRETEMEMDGEDNCNKVFHRDYKISQSDTPIQDYLQKFTM
jgi:hypothetical protein